MKNWQSDRLVDAAAMTLVLFLLCCVGFFTGCGTLQKTQRPAGAKDARLCLPADCEYDEDGNLLGCSSRVCTDGWVER